MKRLPLSVYNKSKWVLVESNDAWCTVNAMRCKRDNSFVDDYIEISDVSSFIKECFSYLPNPYKQARLDIPRMHVTLRHERLYSFDELAKNIVYEQLRVITALCTQVVMGKPYGIACNCVPSTMIICERSPSSHTFIELITKDEKPPYYISSVHVEKIMTAKHIKDEEYRDPKVDVSMQIDLDLKNSSYAMTEIKITHSP